MIKIIILSVRNKFLIYLFIVQSFKLEEEIKIEIQDNYMLWKEKRKSQKKANYYLNALYLLCKQRFGSVLASLK